MQSNLLEYLTKINGNLSEEEALRIFKMIVDGVAYCHGKGFMHHDLKLENILVNFDENTMRITELCISDFGFGVKNKKRTTQA